MRKHIFKYKEFLFEADKYKLSDRETLVKFYAKTPDEMFEFLFKLTIKDLFNKFDDDFTNLIISSFIKSFSPFGQIKYRETKSLGYVGFKLTRPSNPEGLFVITDSNYSNKIKDMELLDKNLFFLPVFPLKDSKPEELPLYADPDSEYYDEVDAKEFKETLNKIKPIGTLGAFLGFDSELNKNTDAFNNTFYYVAAKYKRQKDIKIERLGFDDNVIESPNEDIKLSFKENFMDEYKETHKKWVDKQKKSDLTSDETPPDEESDELL